MAYEKHFWVLGKLLDRPYTAITAPREDARDPNYPEHNIPRLNHSGDPVSEVVLKRLLKAGLVEPIPQTLDPDQAVWHVTAEGARRLATATGVPLEDAADHFATARAAVEATWRHDERLLGYRVRIRLADGRFQPYPEQNASGFAPSEVGTAVYYARPRGPSRLDAVHLASAEGMRLAREAYGRPVARLETVSDDPARDGVTLAEFGHTVDEFGDLAVYSDWTPELADFGLSGLHPEAGYDIGVAGARDLNRYSETMGTHWGLSMLNYSGYRTEMHRRAAEFRDLRVLADTLATATSEPEATAAIDRLAKLSESLHREFLVSFPAETAEAAARAEYLEDVNRLGRRLGRHLDAMATILEANGLASPFRAPDPAPADTVAPGSR